ncbi:HipA domain-containing protein [Candidatus Halobeggiatoa sp. HSG11]|nr:HipA domain-containing protein [Candidatus Halobeggiatoa sp. HSG11]
METNVWVYANWSFPDAKGLQQAFLVGKLTSSLIRNKESFSFDYSPEWLNSPYKLSIDPELQLFSGRQFSDENKNFRIFLDSCPDRWGRLLMKRREAVLAHEEQRKPKLLNEIDYLLGVHDQYRMGGLRFKLEPSGPFLDNNEWFAAPPMSNLHELEYAVTQIEGDHSNDEEYKKWLFMLMSPGSSLGGARPKASVINDDGSLWIAKFPNRFDDYDVGAWEYVLYQLALDAGINMAESRIMRFKHHHIFLTKRFDRDKKKRLHFTSAMTQLGYYDSDYEASYLELAEFLSNKGGQTKLDLEQLWRRIIFNIAVSNTDDHLRNHGFILAKSGWLLSPAYDLNPVVSAHGLHLNITDNDNSLDFDLAMEVIDFFQIKSPLAKRILIEVKKTVSNWSAKATNIGISRSEQERMEPAFQYR